MGTIFSPGAGTVSKVPNCVITTSAGLERELANEGRELKTVGPLRSGGTVLLKGGPDRAMRNGLRRKACGSALVPPKKTRRPTPQAARPLRSPNSYGFE